MNKDIFRKVAIYYVDTGTDLMPLVRSVVSDEECSLNEKDSKTHIEEMINHGLLTIDDTGWIRVSESGWEFWAAHK
jgi:hypothetical protein